MELEDRLQWVNILSGSFSKSKLTNLHPKAQREAHFELGITLSLFLWPSLSLAVANQWGGPDSASKREMFASAAIDLLKENLDADEAWIEEFLLQVMLDEFEVNVDDESGADVAEQICRLRKDCGKGNFEEVVALKERWESRKGNEVGGIFQKREGGEEDDGEDDESSGSEEDEEDEDMDVDMDEAPQLVRTREAVVPEVDEDGFTKVTKKKR